MGRTVEMQKVVDGMAKTMFGRSNTEALTHRVCVVCGQPVAIFRDDISRREYKISGMCQKCQDSTFGA